MKSLILPLLSLTFSASAFAGDDGFSCVSRWYRDAELTVNSGVISVQDSYVHGSQEVGKLVEAKLNLREGDYSVNTVALYVNRDQGVSCRGSGLVRNCEGSALRAHVTVKGWITAGGMHGELNLSVPVELKSLQLQTNLGSGGPIKLSGDEPTVVRLGYLNLHASAKVVVQGREMDLAWSTFFNSRDDRKSGSSCSKY